MKLILTMLFVTCFHLVFPQVSLMREDFFKQHMDEVVRDNKKYYSAIIFNETRMKWDTTNSLTRCFLANIDSVRDSASFQFKHRPTRKKIVSLSRTIGDPDFKSFSGQIKRQDTDKFITRIVVKGENRKEKHNTCNMYFSQPLISADNKMLLVIERIEASYCFTTRTSVYRRVNDKWTKDFDLTYDSICE